MVRVPTYDNFGVLGVNTQDPLSRSQASPQAFGAGVGQAMQGLGQDVQQAANAGFAIKQEVAQLNVESRFTNETSGLFSQADRAYTSSMGKNAVDGYENAMKNLDDIRKKTLSGIDDPFERQNMEHLLNGRYQQSADAYNRHQGNQLEVYKNETFTGYLSTLSQGAIDNSFDDTVSDRYLRSGEAHIEAWGMEQGKSLEWTNQHIRQFRDRTYSDIISMKLNTDPYEAMQWAQKNHNKISPEIYAKTQHDAQPYLDAELEQSFIRESTSGHVTTGGEQGLRNAMFHINKTSIQPPAEIKGIIDVVAPKYNLSNDLVKGVVHAESRFINGRTSSAGAQGLMQLMPATAKELGLKGDDVHDPAKNIDAGCRYLKQMMNKYGDNEAVALAAYNWGLGNVDKVIKKLGSGATTAQIIAQCPPETKNYVHQIVGGIEAPEKKGNPVPQQAQAQKSPSFSYPPKTQADNVAWYQSASASIPLKTNNPRQQGLLMRKLDSQFTQQREILNETMRSNNKMVMDLIVTDEINNGSVDFSRILKANPEFSSLYKDFPPEKKLEIQDRIGQKNKEALGDIDRTEKKQKEAAKEQGEAFKKNSEQTKFGIFARYGDDKTKWRELDVLSEPNLSWDDREDLRKKQEEVLGGKQDKLLVGNSNEARKIFEEEFILGIGSRVAFDNVTGEPSNPSYFPMLGEFQELVRHQQKVNGGKTIDSEAQRKLALSLLKKAPQSYVIDSKGGYASGWTVDKTTTSDRPIGHLLYDWTREGQPLYGSDPQESLQEIQAQISKGAIVDPMEVKKALDKKGKR